MWFEGDVLVVRVVGTMGLPETQRLIDMGEQLFVRYGYILILMDARHSAGMTAEARKLQTERLKRFIRPSHTAIFHVNAVGRMMSALAQRGIELVTGKTYAVSFHKDEAEARAQVAVQRVTLQRSPVVPRG